MQNEAPGSEIAQIRRVLMSTFLQSLSNDCVWTYLIEPSSQCSASAAVFKKGWKDKFGSAVVAIWQDDDVIVIYNEFELFWRGDKKQSRGFLHSTVLEMFKADILTFCDQLDDKDNNPTVCTIWPREYWCCQDWHEDYVVKDWHEIMQESCSSLSN